MSLSDIKLGLKRWMAGELGFTVIFADQDGPQPIPKPYATIRLDTQAAVGGEEQGAVNGGGIVTVKGHRRRTAMLEIIGPNALSHMETIRDSLGKVTVLGTLYGTCGVSVIDSGTIQNLTQLLETKHEERASLDLILAYATEIEDEVGVIEHVEINENIIDIETP